MTTRPKIIREEYQTLHMEYPPEHCILHLDVPGGKTIIGKGHTRTAALEIANRGYDAQYPRPVTTGMPFGEALMIARQGKRVARAGWNGKGMWISYSPGALKLPAHMFWAAANKEFAMSQPDGMVDVLPCLTMKTADNKILMGWLASQTDMLADDWLEVS